MKLSKLIHSQFDASFKTLLKMPGVPAKSMFAIRGIARIVAEATSNYEDSRKQIIEEFAEKDSKGDYVRLAGNSIKIQPAKIKDMDKKFRDLSEIEVKIPELKFSDLGDAPILNSEDLYHLDFIVE